VKLALHREANEWCIEVSDSGIGMTREQMVHLYEPFNRLGRERAGIEGTGLGLALTRQLVLLMQGRIDVVSEVEVGTRVTVCLPVGEQTHSATTDGQTPSRDTAAPADADPEGTVLYIEDNPVNMMLVEQLLARWPRVLLVQAADGAAGITAASRSKPDVVLLDMQLPDMDGVAVLKRLRAADGTRDLPVVALSASAMAPDVQAALEAGADDYWTKPLDFAHFEREMRRLLRAATA
jgi:CheY-like chemotaxis protein